MDRNKNGITYSFTKPSNQTCIDIMSGIYKNDISQDNAKKLVTIKIPYIGVVWLRGYDSEKVCDKVDEIEPKTLTYRNNDSKSSHTFAIVFTIFLILAITGLVLFLFPLFWASILKGLGILISL